MIKITTKMLALLTAAALVGISGAALYGQPPYHRSDVDDAPANESLGKAPTWQPPSAEDVRREVFAWLDAQGVDQSTRSKAEQLWSVPPSVGHADVQPNGRDSPTGAELLSRVAQTLALGDQRARNLVDLCSKPRSDLIPPSQPWLADPKTPPLIANNLRLLYGRWLAHESLFDESLEQLAGLGPQDVVDPASLLFYQAVVNQRLVDRQSSLEAIERLLDGAEQSPRRYAAVARLMQADLKGLEEDTLDHIARRMEDIQRRLDLGRAGQRVRQIQDGVIESLDKLIKELEEQQKQQSGAGASNIQPSSPAPDSRILEGKGPGEVTKRDIGSQSGWGNLPPKKRQEAMQQIGREFPSHYRDVIEQYFRKLASEGD